MMLVVFNPPQIHFHRLAPGMVQQLQAHCDVCNGEGEIINGEPLDSAHVDTATNSDYTTVILTRMQCTRTPV